MAVRQWVVRVYVLGKVVRTYEGKSTAAKDRLLERYNTVRTQSHAVAEERPIEKDGKR